MDHLRRLGNSISIPIQADENAFTGRECPQPDCEGYFKIEFGTGLKGEGLPCHCPYCGHIADHNQFWTKEQIEYATSVAMRQITDAFHKDLKKLEFDHKPKGAFGIGLSMKVKPGSPDAHPLLQGEAARNRGRLRQLHAPILDLRRLRLLSGLRPAQFAPDS